MCGSCLCSKKANVTRGQMSVTKGPSCARQTGMWNFPGSPHYCILCNSPRDTLAGIASKYLEASFSKEINQTHQIIDDLRLQRLRAWEVLQIANGLPNSGRKGKKRKDIFSMSVHYMSFFLSYNMQSLISLDQTFTHVPSVFFLSSSLRVPAGFEWLGVAL